MLNDLSRRIRLSILFQTLGPSLVIGALVGMQTVSTASLVLLGVLALSLPAWFLWSMITGRRAENGFWDEVVTGSEEILAGAVRPTSVPARVVRHRVLEGRPHFALTSGRGEGPSWAMAATVVGDGPPRRVGVLVAPLPGLQPQDAPFVVAVHPDRPEVAVLDDGVAAADLTAADQDPRWAGPLPTDRSVLGRGWPIVGFALGGLALGLGVGFALMRLVS